MNGYIRKRAEVEEQIPIAIQYHNSAVWQRQSQP
jgi:hypothetical protein